MKGGNRNDPREFIDPMDAFGVWRVPTDHAGGVDVPPITRFRWVRGGVASWIATHPRIPERSKEAAGTMPPA